MGFIKAILEKLFGCFIPHGHHDYHRTPYMTTPYESRYSATAYTPTSYHDTQYSVGKMTAVPTNDLSIRTADLPWRQESVVPTPSVAASSVYSTQPSSVPRNPIYDHYYCEPQYGWVYEFPTEHLLRFANELPTPHLAPKRTPRTHVASVDWGY